MHILQFGNFQLTPKIIRRREQQSSKEDDIVFVGISCHSCFLHLSVQVGKGKRFRSKKAKFREYNLTSFSEHYGCFAFGTEPSFPT